MSRRRAGACYTANLISPLPLAKAQWAPRGASCQLDKENFRARAGAELVRLHFHSTHSGDVPHEFSPTPVREYATEPL